MKAKAGISKKDILIVVGIVVAVLIGLSTQWALASNPLLTMMNI